MLTKFEWKSVRVKGVSFHPKRPWVLCGLHNGMIQIHDYRMGKTIDQYEEHEAPVRGVDFHCSQPLFVSGSDDCKIKVWNFKLRRCLFTLTGHIDYIRTVQFHSSPTKQQPWILSASDDHSIRIWNWQNRSCIALLRGHTHYVMSAQFHPREDLVVSASLDLSIRVWDISGLHSRKDDSNPMSLSNDLLGYTDVVVKQSLEGHEKGVNWASFHPTKPFIVSGSDDRSIRVWRMDDARGYEVGRFGGHSANVSCVMYYKDLILSNSEDRTIRLWDPSLNSNLETYRDAERFWVLAVHPTNGLIAAGHDGGVMVFKLARERPAHTIHNGMLYYTREAELRSYDFNTGVDRCPMKLRRRYHPAYSLSCNPGDNVAAVWYEKDGGVYDLITIPKVGGIADAEPRNGFYTNAVFFALNKFATLDKTNQIVLRTTSNEISKVLPSVNNCNRIFPGPSGFLLCRNDEKVFLFQVSQRAVVAEIRAVGVKYVTWDHDFTRVALQSKNSIVVATRKLKHIATITEPSVRVKSAAFDEERDILFYTTLNHLKYCNLRTTECSTVKTLDVPIYLMRAKGDKLWYLRREGEVQCAMFDNSELSFKLALQQERYRDVLKIIQAKKLHGQALVSYLHKHGHPEIAMTFVSDAASRFNLAIECGAMDIAKTTATELNQPEVWGKLADSATHFGDIQLAQFANSKINNHHHLGLQCLITGNIPALGHLVDKSKDQSFKLQYGLYTGDVEHRLKALVSGGMLPLAYSLAMSNNLVEEAERLLGLMDPDVAERCRAQSVRPAIIPAPVTSVTDNWPMLPVQESYFTRMLKEPGLLDYVPEVVDAPAGWGDEDDLLGDEDELGAGPTAAATLGDDLVEPTAAAGEWDDDLDIDESMMPAAVPEAVTSKGGFVMPREGDSIPKHWVDHSQLAAYHVAAGSFQSAMELLRRQIGLVDPSPLQPYFMHLYAAVNVTHPSWALIPSHTFALTTRPAAEELRAKHAPAIPKLTPLLQEKIKAGYAAVTEARFADALRLFVSVIHMVMLCVVDNKTELSELLEILNVAREYVQAINVELIRKETEDPQRKVELAAYFTHFKLQSSHLVLANGQAMTQAFNTKNFKTASALARRLLDLDPPQERAERARKVIHMAEANPKDTMKLDYDERNPFTLCCVSKKPMYRGTVEVVRCSYCYSAAHPDFKGKRCPVCTVANIGAQAAGMVNGVFQLK